MPGDEPQLEWISKEYTEPSIFAPTIRKQRRLCSIYSLTQAVGHLSKSWRVRLVLENLAKIFWAQSDVEIPSDVLCC